MHKKNKLAIIDCFKKYNIWIVFMFNISLSLLPSLYYLSRLFKLTKVGVNDGNKVHSMSKRINEYVHSLGVQKKVFLCETEDYYKTGGFLSVSVGTQNIIIFAHKGLYEVDSEGFSFFLKHEIAHIVNNDDIRNTTTSLIVSIFGGVLFGCFLPLYFSIPLTLFFNTSGSKIRKRRQEDAADLWAIRNSNVEDLKGGLRFFRTIQAIERCVKCNWDENLILEMIKKDETSKKTDHSDLNSRIKKIEDALDIMQGHHKFIILDYLKIKSIAAYNIQLLLKRNNEEVDADDQKIIVDYVIKICMATQGNEMKLEKEKMSQKIISDD